MYECIELLERVNVYMKTGHYVCMVYKYIDIVGTSPNGSDDSIRNAVEEAAKTVKNLQWGELGRVTVRIEDGKILEFQSEVRLGFKIEHG